MRSRLLIFDGRVVLVRLVWWRAGRVLFLCFDYVNARKVTVVVQCAGKQARRKRRRPRTR